MPPKKDIFTNDSNNNETDDDTESSQMSQTSSDENNYPFISFILSTFEKVEPGDSQDSHDSQVADKLNWQAFRKEFKAYADAIELMQEDKLFKKIYDRAIDIRDDNKDIKYSLSAALMQAIRELKPLIQKIIDEDDGDEEEMSDDDGELSEDDEELMSEDDETQTGSGRIRPLFNHYRY